MSAPAGNRERSRPSNGSYPASDDGAPEPADLDRRPEVPTPSERIREVLDEYPERALVDLSTEHGRKLRADCMEDPVERSETVRVGETEEIVVPETVARSSLTWIGALAELLDRYEGYRDKRLRLVRGSEARGDRETFAVDMDMSFSPVYQTQQYARLQALKRQLIGGEYPSGRECEGEFDDPVTVLLSLTASSLAGGEFRGPVDHDRAIREAWSGSSSSVKRSLRYLLEDRLGLDSSDYAWWWQSEPHPGGGDASGYSHSHPVVVLDRAAADPEGPEVAESETWRPIVAKHVAECEGAEWSAHDLETAVSVREAGEIEDFASYVAEYIAVSPDEDLLERSPEYLLWAASQFASSTQKYSRSRWATAATKADRCQQEADDPEAEQVLDHGETVVRSDRQGIEFECAECGSPHGIDQSESSLVRRRLAASEGVAVADGGEVSESVESGESGRTLAERWPSARSAVSVGSETRARECGHPEPDTCPLCATETEAPEHTVSGEVPIPESASAPEAEREVESVEREPEWRPEAVVQEWSGEETLIGSPGGVEYAEVVVPGEGSALSRSSLEYLPPVASLEGPRPWEGTSLFTEREVRSGEVPPPEVVAKETAEMAQSGRVTTDKRWSDDWYAERFGGGETASGGECAIDVEAVRELVRVEGVASVPAVMGRLGIDPSEREAVAEAIDSAGPA